MSHAAQASDTSEKINTLIGERIGAARQQVAAATTLLDDGATVPFISRYRKEVTGGLSDKQLRDLEEQLNYLRELQQRRLSIVQAIEQQGKLDENLRAKIDRCATKAELEDLYLPYKKKRRTKGQIAIEAGLEPLAQTLWDNPDTDPQQYATRFIRKAEQVADKVLCVADEKAALEGARYILMERFAEDAALIARLRSLLQDQSFLCAQVVKGKAGEGAKFADYFDHQEPLSKVPGHRALAMFRGRSEGVLKLQLLLKQVDEYNDHACIAAIAAHTGFSQNNRPADAWREQVVAWTWKVKLSMHLESELFAALRAKADSEAIQVFASNLKDLLLAAPAGSLATMGLDPGYRSGVKVVVIDANGRVLEHATVYPHKPQQQWDKTVHILSRLCVTHAVQLIAVGNGTASRETEKLADEVLKKIAANKTLPVNKVLVSEAGASVYSASKLAEDEFPDLDVTIRGAVSIARRLQDPLAELVKIDPKAIGVGQYQHDVSQVALAKSLDATVEDCVNSVGVDLETASIALLSRVAGLSPVLAANIVEYRDNTGMFKTRKELTKVARLGPKAFEQCAGFLRIRGGKDPLDRSGVHPESYPVVKRILASTDCALPTLIGNVSVLRSLDANEFVDERFGLPTVKDIISELEKPGRDPRPEFKTVKFTDGIESLADLKADQVLQGQVTNVTAFGAFVDIGVHQDGLVHISALSNTYVKDPREVVKTGEIVTVKIMSVDVSRKRIALSMRLTDRAAEAQEVNAGSAKKRHSDDRAGNGVGNKVRQTSTKRAGTAQSSNRSAQGSQRGSDQRGTSRQENRTSGTDPESALALQLKAALNKK